MEKPVQDLKNEINLPAGRQSPSVLRKAVLRPPRMPVMAPPEPPAPSQAPASAWGELARRVLGGTGLKWQEHSTGARGAEVDSSTPAYSRRSAEAVCG